MKVKMIAIARGGNINAQANLPMSIVATCQCEFLAVFHPLAPCMLTRNRRRTSFPERQSRTVRRDGKSNRKRMKVFWFHLHDTDADTRRESPPPVGERRDVHVGDIFMHTTSSNPEPIFWICTVVANYEPTWTNIALGGAYPLNDLPSHLHLAITPSGELAWVQYSTFIKYQRIRRLSDTDLPTSP